MLCACELAQNRALFLPTRSAAYHLVFPSCSSLSQRAPRPQNVKAVGFICSPDLVRRPPKFNELPQQG